MGEWLFGPGSVMWKINRESVLLLGGRAALLMQLAHPLVAAAVAEHSNFRADPLGRLRRTLDVMLTVIFGDVDTARKTVEGVNALHARVTGTASDGQTYRALDPHLLLWVYATLVDSSINTYRALVGPLTDDEAARYYDEGKVIARMFGIPDEVIPARLAGLHAWMRSMIDSREVRVTTLAYELADPILRPVRFVPKGLARSTAVIEAALLPAEIREGYGLKDSWPQRAVLAAGRGAARVALPLLPARLRRFPAARAAGA